MLIKWCSIQVFMRFICWLLDVIENSVNAIKNVTF